MTIMPPPDGSLAGIRILVVEDDDDNREIIETTLTLEGASVMAVATAREALPLLSKVDIFLTDFIMPGEDGVWLLEQVNTQPQPVPVIAISGFDESQEPRLAAAPFPRQVAQAPRLQPGVCRDRRSPWPSTVIARLDASGRRLRAALAA